MILTYPCTSPFFSQKKIEKALKWRHVCWWSMCTCRFERNRTRRRLDFHCTFRRLGERVLKYLRFHSLPHRSWCTMQEKIWRCFSNPMSRCKNATQSHAARGNWPRCELFATVHLLVVFNMPWWLKDAESPLPQIKTQHLLEWTEFNRPEYWGNPWSQIDIVLNLNF